MVLIGPVMDLLLKAIREQVASSIEWVVHLERMRNGTRKIVNVSEVQGMENDTIVMQDSLCSVKPVSQTARFKGGSYPLVCVLTSWRNLPPPALKFPMALLRKTANLDGGRNNKNKDLPEISARSFCVLRGLF